jgi:hypothetical protein
LSGETVAVEMPPPVWYALVVDGHLLVIGDDHEPKLEVQRHTGDRHGRTGPVTVPGSYAQPETSAPLRHALMVFTRRRSSRTGWRAAAAVMASTKTTSVFK